MLKLELCASPADKSRIFQSADPRKDSWIVSDLQSKWHLQGQWLDRDGVLEQNACLRASELWRHLALQVRPELRYISQELAQTLIWHWLEPKKLPWARTPQSVAVVARQMQMWISVFADRNYQSVMAEWFAAHPEAVERFGHWYVLCSELWEWFNERNYMVLGWLPGLLLNEDLSSVRWPKRLFFDLGPQITLVEGQLLRELGRVLDVTVLYPAGDWLALMPETLRPYEPLLDKPFRGDSGWQPPARDAFEFGRFSTQLAEIKDAVAQVREWLDQGVSPETIAIVAPDIEELWPVLNLYLREEGIPTQKSVVTKLGSFLEMGRWLAALRTGLSRLSTADLELSAFDGERRPRLSIEEFRRLFTYVFEEKDLNRAEGVFQSGKAPARDRAIPFRDFLPWALGVFPEGATMERLEKMLEIAAKEVPEALDLPPAEWLSFIEGLFARRDWTVTDANPEGIWAVSLSSSPWLKATHGLFLNLHEAGLRNLDRSPVPAADVRAIYQDTGFPLSAEDRQHGEFEFLWFLQKPWTRLRLTFSETDLEGRELTPARLWMWTAFRNGNFKEQPEAPRLTRWDEVQRSLVAGGAMPVNQEALRRETDLNGHTLGVVDEVRFSASGLARFWQCPFLFAVEKRWRLNDLSPVDLDLDRRTRGQLLHALLERLCEEPIRYDWSEDELKNLVREARVREKVLVGDERLWPAVEAEHVHLAKIFLDFEKNWRSEFPATKTVARELSVEGYWDISTSRPVREKTPFFFSGRIDRVDSDGEGHYALIDYKSSSGKLTHWGPWIEKGDIQLAFYAYLVEEGLAEIQPGAVASAHFYVVADRDRRKGFQVPSLGEKLFNSEEKTKAVLDEGAKKDLFRELGEKVSSALAAIRDGDLNPLPKDPKNCKSCLWRPTCRAPHLN